MCSKFASVGEERLFGSSSSPGKNELQYRIQNVQPHLVRPVWVSIYIIAFTARGISKRTGARKLRYRSGPNLGFLLRLSARLALAFHLRIAVGLGLVRIVSFDGFCNSVGRLIVCTPSLPLPAYGHEET